MTTNSRTRTESDSMGTVAVPAKRLWGAQTERARHNFAIGDERMPLALIHALALIKRAAADCNRELAGLDSDLADAIAAAADEVAAGDHDGEFPLSVWQTGSGTQTNMNVNEVIANRANAILGHEIGNKHPVHPNDHVNMSQSSNDSVPTAMHIAAAIEIRDRLLSAMGHLQAALEDRATAFADLIKIGRTHLQDAVPLTLGQAFSGYADQVAQSADRVAATLPGLHAVAQGGTAVGTGLNAPKGFAAAICERLGTLTGLPLVPAANPFEAQASHDALVACSGALNTYAAGLTKIANDIRLAASGPRAGLGEITLPANEPGSSILPGKVNPTQCEAVVMVAAQVTGNHVATTMGGAGGHFELNACKPLIAYNVLQSIRMLSDVSRSFTDHCVAGIEAVPARLAELVDRSLMLVTALTPHIGYDRAAAIAKHAHETGTTLREAAIALDAISAADFDRLIQPENMVGDRDR